MLLPVLQSVSLWWTCALGRIEYQDAVFTMIISFPAGSAASDAEDELAASLNNHAQRGDAIHGRHAGQHPIPGIDDGS